MTRINRQALRGCVLAYKQESDIGDKCLVAYAMLWRCRNLIAAYRGLRLARRRWRRNLARNWLL